MLTRPPSQISLREVVEAVDGPIVGEAPPGLDALGGGSDDSACRRTARISCGTISRRGWRACSGEIRVADVCREAVRRSVLRDLPNRFDYEIWEGSEERDLIESAAPWPPASRNPARVLVRWNW